MYEKFAVCKTAGYWFLPSKSGLYFSLAQSAWRNSLPSVFMTLYESLKQPSDKGSNLLANSIMFLGLFYGSGSKSLFFIESRLLKFLIFCNLFC